MKFHNMDKPLDQEKLEQRVIKSGMRSESSQQILKL